MCIPKSSSGKAATVLVRGRILQDITLVAEDVHQERRVSEGQSHTTAGTAGIDPGFASTTMSEEWQLFVKAGNGKSSPCLKQSFQGHPTGCIGSPRVASKMHVQHTSRDTVKSGSSQSADSPGWLQEEEVLLERYQTWAGILLAQCQALEVAGLQSQLGFEFSGDQRQGDSRIFCLRRCPRKTT